MARFRKGSEFGRDAFRSYRRFRRSYRKYKKHRIIGGKRKVNPMLLTSKNKTKAKLNLPITPRYLTKFTYGFAGSNAGGVRSGGKFVIKLNSPLIPGDYTGVASVRFTDQGGVMLSPNDITTLQSAGFSQLCNENFYFRYRVGASSIRVTCQPTDPDDVILLTVFPLNANLSTNLAGTQTSANRAQQLPFSKEHVCTSNNDVKDNTIHNYIDVPTLEGKRKEQVLDDDQYQAIYSANPTQINLWVVTWQNISGANTTGPINWNIQSIYYTELSELVNPSQGPDAV